MSPLMDCSMVNVIVITVYVCVVCREAGQLHSHVTD